MRLAVLLLCFATGACGLKGDLYLPPEPLEAEPSATAGDEADASAPAVEQAGTDSASETTDDVDNRRSEDDTP